MPTSTLKISVLLKIVLVAGAVSRIHLLCVWIPTVPARPEVPVRPEEIMMVVDQTPIRCYPGSVLVLPPPAVRIMLPAFYDLFFFRRWPCLHELLRRLKFLFYPARR